MMDPCAGVQRYYKDKRGVIHRIQRSRSVKLAFGDGPPPSPWDKWVARFERELRELEDDAEYDVLAWLRGDTDNLPDRAKFQEQRARLSRLIAICHKRMGKKP